MNKYDDIINIIHYEPKNHKRMSIESRSAQFAPFAALTGYNDCIKDASEYVVEKFSLSDDMYDSLNDKLCFIEDNINKNVSVDILYYNKKKNGGNIIKYSGIVKKIDGINRNIIFIDNKIIYLDNIYNIIINGEF